MKTVQDKNGNILEVEDNTPCHPGKNGALPIMLDEVEDADILQEMAEREAAYQAGAFQRAKDKKLNELKEYYKSDTVRSLMYNNHLVYLTDSATRGADSKWLRLNINGDVTDITWGFDDGSTQVMTKADVELFTNFLSDNDERLRHMKRYHKAAINALTTEAEVNSYDITADINGLSWI